MATKLGVFRGDRLRLAREKSGLTQDELANDLGFGPTQMNKYENGKNAPSVKALVGLAKRLNVSSDWLLGLTDDPREGKATLSPEAERFATAVNAGDFTKVIEMALDNIKSGR